MHKRIRKYQSDPFATFGPLYSADPADSGTGGGGGSAAAGSDPKGEQPNPASADGKDAERLLGEGGKKALEAERTARKELESQLAQMREGLAQVFGEKPNGKATAEELVGSLTAQVAALQHSALVDRLALRNEITDDDDIDLLRSAKDEDAMTRLAARLGKNAGGGSQSNTPKPDRTQGGQGGEGIRPEVLPGVPRMAQAFEDELANK